MAQWHDPQGYSEFSGVNAPLGRSMSVPGLGRRYRIGTPISGLGSTQGGRVRSSRRKARLRSVLPGRT